MFSNNGVDYTTTTDYASPVSQTLSEDPDVLFVGGPSQPTALVMEEARSQGFKGGFMVMDQAKFQRRRSSPTSRTSTARPGCCPSSSPTAPA